MRQRPSAVAIFAALAACAAPPLENAGPPPGPPCGRRPGWFPGWGWGREKVDILFVIDNSNGMEDKAAALRNRLPALLGAFREAADQGIRIDAHFGVITSDYGAGWSGAPGCSSSPGGQQGRLQGIGKYAPRTCKKPTGGVNFVHYAGEELHNLPQGQDLEETLRCMMSVGDNGCGFEHPLEAAYAALHDNIPENLGFLREDAMLAVLFLTDEDDASAPPDTDIFDKNRAAEYGYLSSYSRQTRFAVQCCPPGRQSCNDNELQFPPYGDSAGPLAGCRPAPNFPTGAGPGKQYDVARYVDFFTRIPAQGGVKTNPDMVILAAIDAPEAPFQVSLRQAGLIRDACPKLDESANPPCIPMLEHSCQNPISIFAGDPAVRLNTVVRAAANHEIGSICDDDYGPVLQKLARAVIDRVGANCLPDLSAPGEDKPPAYDCIVEDVTENPDGTTAVAAIPQCPGNGANPGQDACYRLVSKPACAGANPGGLGITVDRAGRPIADSTYLRAWCDTACTK